MLPQPSMSQHRQVSALRADHRPSIYCHHQRHHFRFAARLFKQTYPLLLLPDAPLEFVATGAT